MKSGSSHFFCVSERYNSGNSCSGFTIVELLVIIVVIAILVVISIVSYRGMTNRAVVASLQSDLANASKQLKIFQVDNDIFPLTIDCSQPNDSTNKCVKSSGDTTYQYSVDNSSNPATFCLTATNNTTSYKIKSSGTLSEGGCDGHEIGGQGPITNYVINPSFETNYSNGGTIGFYNGTLSLMSEYPYSGNQFLRSVFGSTPGTGRGQFSGVLPAGIYTGTYRVRSNQAVKVNTYFQGTATKSYLSISPKTTLVPNVWTTLYATIEITVAGTIQVGGYSDNDVGAAGDYIDYDAFSLVSGSVAYDFADGNSTNWIWNGTTNLSTSTGLIP